MVLLVGDEVDARRNFFPLSSLPVPKRSILARRLGEGRGVGEEEEEEEGEGEKEGVAEKKKVFQTIFFFFFFLGVL